MTPTDLTHFAPGWAPLIPWDWWLVCAGISLVLVVPGLLRRARGGMWRVWPLAIVLLALANPQVVEESERRFPDMVLVLVDDSPSQGLAQRPAQTEAALSALRHAVSTHGAVELREVRLSQLAPSLQAGAHLRGTRLITALQTALADIPRQRLAATVVISDGQVHDLPSTLSADITRGAPVHVLLTGAPGETDRRLILDRAPAFALVGDAVPVTLRVDDAALPPGSPIVLTLRSPELPAPETLTAVNGRALTVPLTVPRTGPTVFSFEAAHREGEPSTVNNSATITVNGIRDRLRVLLVSGKPHMGERAWRQLLKADPNVDLIHFTILRSPLKADSAPLNELALIAFPMRELFEEKLAGFDLIIFDTYSRQGPVLATYFDNIARYVRHGGALLVAAGPDFAASGALADSPLASVLPVRPSGPPMLGSFVPRLSALGERHPITASLPMETSPQSPSWGPWLRMAPTTVIRPSAHTLMVGPNDLPLLVVDRVEKGRVGVILSDSLWLWARGWQGGGPQAELVRRAAHWLMGEPDLEEDALVSRADQGQLVIERRSLQDNTDTPPLVTITAPNGERHEKPLTPVAPGRWNAQIPAQTPGLWHIRANALQSAVAVPDPDPLETAAVVATDQILRPLVENSGGGVFWLSQGNPATAGVPALRTVSSDGVAHAARSAPAENTWMGLRSRGYAVTTGYQQHPLLPAALVMLILLGALVVVWRQEGR